MTAAIDVAIGLVLMYLVLSLFCTTINEFIANILKLRANKLRDTLAELIDDPTLKKFFYNHGLIDGAKVAATAGGAKPANSANPAGVVASSPQSPHPSYLSSKSVAMALIDSVVCMANNSNPNIIPTVTDVANAVIPGANAALKTLPDSNIRDAIIACLAQANNIDELRDELARWFDAAMDRLSGAYKRHLRFISACVAAGLVIAFNADTINVAKTLWNEPTTAATVSQSASQFFNSDAAKKQCGDNAKPIDCDIQEMKALDQTLEVIPLGWNKAPAGLDWLYKIVGLFATGIALTLGAPFWFDLLGQFVNLRGAGTKPKTAAS